MTKATTTATATKATATAKTATTTAKKPQMAQIASNGVVFLSFPLNQGLSLKDLQTLNRYQLDKEEEISVCGYSSKEVKSKLRGLNRFLLDKTCPVKYVRRGNAYIIENERERKNALAFINNQTVINYSNINALMELKGAKGRFDYESFLTKLHGKSFTSNMLEYAED